MVTKPLRKKRRLWERKKLESKEKDGIGYKGGEIGEVVVFVARQEAVLGPPTGCYKEMETIHPSIIYHLHIHPNQNAHSQPKSVCCKLSGS